ncbi:MAG: hypothetical protein EBX41_05185 [Chitinophagia bacterium]|nr:hypothetical protein [Chitinophagia bacterium]
MWENNNKVWQRYNNKVLASQPNHVAYAMRFIKHITKLQSVIHSIEVLDLYTTQLHRSPKNIKRALKENQFNPFVFTLHKN